MNKRILSTLLALVLILCGLTGCGEAVGEIAGNVAEAAQAELETQVKAAFEKYKVDIIELKTAIGKLNGTSGDIQFFCAALVQSDSDAIPQDVADSLSKLFHDAGLDFQTGSQIENKYLEHKELRFKFSDFDASQTYYVVWCYTDKLPSLTGSESAPETTPGVG